MLNSRRNDIPTTETNKYNEREEGNTHILFEEKIKKNIVVSPQKRQI